MSATKPGAASDPMSTDSTLLVRRIAVYCETSTTPTDSAINLARKAWAAAVIFNPFCGEADSSQEPFVALGEQLGEQLGGRALQALGQPAHQCCSYGKGAIVGTGSEMGQAASILHPKLGKPLRALLGRGKAIIPSTVKHGGPGGRIDVPLHGIDDEWNFKLLDSVEVFVPGSPRHDEIVVVVALASGASAVTR